MSLNIHYCRLCLQKTEETSKTLSKYSKIFALITNLFPGMDTSLVINSKLCSECFKSVQFSNLVIESVKKNEQKILLNLQNTLERTTCSLCLRNENLEVAVCLGKNTNEEARHINHIIEMAIIGLDFDISRKPVMCNNCWQNVKFIYLFKKKCFTTEEILKYYCASNKINSLDRKGFEIVSLSFQKKLQQFSENLSKQKFAFDRNAESICNLNLIKNVMNPPDMYSNNFPKIEQDVDEKVPDVVDIIKVESDLPKEEYEIDIVEEKLCKFDDSNEKQDMAVDTMSLESLDNIQDTEITSDDSKVLLNKIVKNNCHSIKSPSVRSSDMEKKIHGPDLLEKPSKKRKIETQLSFKGEEDLFYDECDYQTKNKVQFKRHCLLHNSNDKLPNSATCISSTTRSHMRNHASEYKTTLSFNCEKCPYDTKEEVDIELHLKAHQSNENILQCSKCYYITACSNSLKSHLETHKTKPKIFKCQECDYVTEKHTSMVTHTSIHQEKYNFKCQECNYRSKSKALLVQHKVVHQENYNFSCDKCNYQAKRKCNLINHMLTHKENRNFVCDRCNYQTKRKEDLTRHMIIHQDKYNFKCSKCSYRAKFKSRLVSHMVVHQENYDYSCDKCDYQSKRKRQMISHMLIHQENYNFSCDRCNYQSKEKFQLTRHMVIHQDSYNFKCPKCSYQAKRKEHLVSHMVVHQENHDFSCDKCDYQSKRKCQMIKHMVIHQDKYNLKCPKCSYQAKCKEHLVSHMVVHQENYDFSCEKCDYQSKRKSQMNKHMVIHQMSTI